MNAYIVSPMNTNCTCTAKAACSATHEIYTDRLQHPELRARVQNWSPEPGELAPMAYRRYSPDGTPSHEGVWLEGEQIERAL